MKKRILYSVMVVLILCLQLHAQVKFDVKGGLNLSKVQFTETGLTYESSNRFGFHVGVQAFISISDKLFLQPELFYSQEGGETHINNLKSKNYFDFLTLPLLFGIKPLPKFKIVAGPQFGYLLSAQSEVNGIKGDIKGIKSMNTSLTFGLGYQVLEKLELYTRYNVGVTNLNDDPLEAREGKINTLQFGLALHLYR
jgi:hypothetical protein